MTLTGALASGDQVAARAILAHPALARLVSAYAPIALVGPSDTRRCTEQLRDICTRRPNPNRLPQAAFLRSNSRRHLRGVRAGRLTRRPSRLEGWLT
jgi:hypothetical protein